MGFDTYSIQACYLGVIYLRGMWNLIKSLELSKGTLPIKDINPIPGGLWNYVVRRGGAIMARMDFRLSKVAKRPVSTQNLLSNRYFNL